jgi:predicted DNA-binding ribbon-helix-helix protein
MFAGQDRADYASVTRSVRLDGMSTSIRLEARYWRMVDQIAESQGLTTPKFLSTLYNEVLDLHGEVLNFASLLRTACLVHLEQTARATEVA